MFGRFLRRPSVLPSSLLNRFCRSYRVQFTNARFMSSDVPKQEVGVAAPAEYDPSNLFAKFIRKEIKVPLIHEDDHCIAFHDINPQAPVHFLVLPKADIAMLSSTKDSDAHILGHCLLVARKLAADLGLQEGFRTVINNGKNGCQSVYHLHVHVLGGRTMSWPPG